MILTPKAKDLVYSQEGIDQPGSWPGGDSGVTLPIGYDLGFTTLPEFNRDWAEHLSMGQLARLAECVGKKGNDAAAAAQHLQDIRILPSVARAVFESRSVPKYWKQVLSIFPGADTLPPDAQGAIWSLVFNRGASLHDSTKNPAQETRREMRAIRDLIAEYAKPCEQPRAEILKSIADQIRSMIRLVPSGLSGLKTRREAEAKLVEGCIAS